MKPILPLFILLLAASQHGCSSMASHHHAADSATFPVWKEGSLAKPDSVWFARAVTDYPLSTCVISGDKLSSLKLTPTDFVVRQTGQADRLVRFCCSDCQKEFLNEPAKYLKLIDDAAAAKVAASVTK